MSSIAPDLVRLLQRRAPDALATLRETFPDEGEALDVVHHQGERDASVALGPTERALRLNLIRTSLPSLIKGIDDLGVDLRRHMQRVINIRFAGTAIAAATGGLAGVLALWLPQNALDAALAFVAMLSALAALFADHFDRAPSGARVSTADEFSRNLERRGEIEVVRIRVERDKVFPNTDDEIKVMIASMDEAAKRVMYLGRR